MVRNILYVKRIFICLAFAVVCVGGAFAEGQLVVSHGTGTGFPLLSGGSAATIVYDSTGEHSVVGIAANALAEDVERLSVSATKPVVQGQLSTAGANVVIGTVGTSALLSEIAGGNAAISAAADSIRGKWETFCLQHITWQGQPALVIMGSDPRGTAYGVFELSRRIGVSPWYWWADVNPETTDCLSVETDGGVYGPPSVKFRGIFLNDEDWGLKPWASAKMDPSISDIGPNTYRRVFELLLRLKANYIWPAMHEVTKAFWYYKDNPVVAREYDIVLGSSHCEPMLRNNVFEWGNMGYSSSNWRWDTNSATIRQYWQTRVREAKNQDAVYTVGMRGIHDGSMPGYSSNATKLEGLKDVIKNQREILQEELGVEPSSVPQIFCPYKEVLTLYKMGLNLPDDVTLCWADDNHGYIRQLSDETEKLRTGGGGVYYHLSYYGAPIDYLWLSSISPSLINFEMGKAYARNCKNLWVFNVGDLKPAECEIQYALDYAWNVDSSTLGHADEFIHEWAEETFGADLADDIEQIKRLYYRLAAEGKPEHVHAISYTEAEMDARLEDYARLVTMVEQINSRIPERLSDAFFELIAYPCRSAAAMNRKHLYASKSFLEAERGNSELTLQYASNARKGYNEIVALTEKYNKTIAAGKWNGMMSYKPRRLSQFNSPTVATTADVASEQKVVVKTDTVVKIPASDYTAISGGSEKFSTVDLLGVGGSSLTVWPLQKTSYSKTTVKSAPYADYTIPVDSGTNYIGIRCLPSFPVYSGLSLRCAASIDGKSPVVYDLTLTAESGLWTTYVIQSYSVASITYVSDTKKEVPLRIYFMDPGLVVSEIDVTMPTNVKPVLTPGSDVTDYYIVNPSFNQNSGGNGTIPTGWTWTGNSGYSKISTGKKPDNATGSNIIIPGDQNHWQVWQENGTMSQTIGELPEGQYRLQATIVPSATGSSLFAGSDKTAITTPGGKFSVDFEINPSKKITIGIDKKCTIIEVDDFRLTYLGPLATSIQGTSHGSDRQHNKAYNLNGQRTVPPYKGIFIIDGKKYQS